MSSFAKAVRIILINLGVFSGLAGVSLLGLELVLRATNWLDQVDSPSPSYIPPKFKIVDSDIDRSGLMDIWGFRSKDGADQLERLRNSNKGKCRIVVLGDSFVQGDGLRVGQRWPDQYQQMTKCDVFAFGRNGWSTIEELAFYEGHLRHLDFDWLVIGFVTNDPDPRLRLDYVHLSDSVFKKYSLPNESYVRLSLGLLGVSSDYHCSRGTASFCWLATRASRPLKIFETFVAGSRALDYLDQAIGTFNNYFPGSKTQDKNGNILITEWGYANWRDRLYQHDMFSMWEGAVTEFKKNVARHKFLFLLTVEAPQQEKMEKVKHSLERAGISYVDCASYNEKLYVSGIRPRRLWANPADAHAGVEQAQGYAQCLYSNLDLKRIQ
jgi:hypothetical protein